MNKYQLKRFWLDVFFPNRCPFCDKIIPWDSYFCDKCPDIDETTHNAVKPHCVDEIVTVCIYNDKIKPFVRVLKNHYSNEAFAAAAELILARIKKDGIPLEFDFVTYIPMHRYDERKRGFNQAEHIAREISVRTGIPLEKMLTKPKRTQFHQKELHLAERRKNIVGAFRAEGSATGKKILLVDDISTTGATLGEAAKTLKYAGAESVCAAVLAKTVYKPKTKQRTERKNWLIRFHGKK